LHDSTTAGRAEGDLLAAAGFQVRVADTPRRLAAIKSLPPNKFVISVVNGRPVYKRLADEAQMTAMMNEEAWDWGPLGLALISPLL
jgi:hypothetical protein